MSIDRSDEEIIKLFKEGKEDLFKELIDRHSPAIYNFVKRIIDKGNAPDILQEIFIKIWKNLHRFDETRASFKTWAFTIAKNTATDYLRKNRDITFSEMEVGIDSDSGNTFSEKIPDDSLLPDEVLQKMQDSKLLNETLKRIPMDYKAVLVLHYEEDMTFDEIGKILNKPLNTVKSQHRRAILMLKKIMII